MATTQKIAALARRAADLAKERTPEATFPEQEAFVADSRKLIAALCSRRAGKSYGNGRRLIRSAIANPGEMSLYVALTKNNARMIVGRALSDLSRRHNLGLRLKEVDQRLMAIHPNGHHIWLSGAKNRPDWEQFRGYKFSEVIIDEAQLYPYLQEIIEEIIEPAVGDLDGAIALTGTPAPIPAGYFYAITEGSELDSEGSEIPVWPTHRWTVAQNAFFRNGHGAEWCQDILSRRGWTEEHPRYVREYLGKWVSDPGSLVFPYVATRNAYWELPEGAWRYALGIDLGGATGTTAFVVAGYRRDHPELYIVAAESHDGLTPSRIAVIAQRLKASFPFSRIVIDEGGLGTGYAQELRESFGLACEAAEKRHKRAYIEMVRGDLLAGAIKIHPHHAGALIAEIQNLQWDEKYETFDPRFSDHCADAFLYVARALRPIYRPQEEGPVPYTPAWSNQIQAEARKRAKKLASQARTKRNADLLGPKRYGPPQI